MEQKQKNEERQKKQEMKAKAKKQTVTRKRTLRDSASTSQTCGEPSSKKRRETAAAINICAMNSTLKTFQEQSGLNVPVGDGYMRTAVKSV